MVTILCFYRARNRGNHEELLHGMAEDAGDNVGLAGQLDDDRTISDTSVERKQYVPFPMGAFVRLDGAHQTKLLPSWKLATHAEDTAFFLWSVENVLLHSQHADAVRNIWRCAAAEGVVLHRLVGSIRCTQQDVASDRNKTMYLHLVGHLLFCMDRKSSIGQGLYTARSMFESPTPTSRMRAYRTAQLVNYPNKFGALELQVAMSTEDMAKFFVHEYHLGRLTHAESLSTMTLNANMVQLGFNMQGIVQDAFQQVQAQNAAVNAVLAANTKRMQEIEAKQKARLEKDRVYKERLEALNDKVDSWMANAKAPDVTPTEDNTAMNPSSEFTTPEKAVFRMSDWTPEEVQVLRDLTSDYTDISNDNVDYVRQQVNRVGSTHRSIAAIYCKAYRLKRQSDAKDCEQTPKRVKKGEVDWPYDVGEYVMAKYKGLNEAYPAFIRGFQHSRIQLEWEDGDTKHTVVPRTDVFRQSILQINGRGKAFVVWVDFEDDAILPKEWIKPDLVSKKALAVFNKKRMPNVADGLLDLHRAAFNSPEPQQASLGPRP